MNVNEDFVKNNPDFITSVINDSKFDAENEIKVKCESTESTDFQIDDGNDSFYVSAKNDGNETYRVVGE